MMLKCRQRLACPTLKVGIVTTLSVTLKQIDRVFMRIDLIRSPVNRARYNHAL